MKKVWVKTKSSNTATRIAIGGDADIFEVVEAAIRRLNCLEGVSEDMVTVQCNGKDVSKSLKVDDALGEGLGVSDRSEAVLVLQLLEGTLYLYCVPCTCITLTSVKKQFGLSVNGHLQ